MSSLIEMDHVTKLYGSVIGLNDVSLSLPEGVYGLLGPNGSGKTTFINLIMGQLRPSIGQVRIMGSNPSWQGAYLRDIGLCPATDIHIPHLSGLDWVTNQVSLYGIPKRRSRQLAIEALKKVRMEHAWDRLISSYSLGMRQRCKLAQAIAHSPRLLILDEPFNGLDPIGRIEMTDFLQKWIENGHSLIMASHILHEVEAVDCSFLLLTGGRLLASGTPTEVRSLLENIPNQVQIKSADARALAPHVMSLPSVSDVKINSVSDTLTVATEAPRALAELLGNLVSTHGYRITEVRPEDESLQSLFSILMQIHRGER